MKEMIKKLQRKSNKKGFTLVEIIVVLVILAILAAIAVPAVLGYVDDAKESKYISEARAIYIVVQTEEAKYKAENGGKTTQIPDSFYTSTDTDGLAKTVESKTEFTKVTVTKAGTKYTLNWHSDKDVTAELTTNKDVKIK